MDHSPQSFDKLLEKYALGVANLFIDQASHGTQTDLINLLIRLETHSESSVNELALTSAKEEKTEWQQILSEPVDPKFLHNQLLLESIRQQMYTNDRCISQLETVVGALEEKNKVIRERFLDGISHDRLQKVNNQLLHQYYTRIQVLKTIRERQLDFLDRVLAR